ncbi:TonB-dependent receptor [Novosphingobium album (ex Liu et al. 2023)]|uniref:TonB-dependent receptor n=1 Tax=Novosphingobium album (ex Liu et al. 2023) TaxID=3031130 RepID=A0ABT5WQS1_9SPHN|nr:TonB-dependent receptor [Novosphingobium album (ex Liu et al. 2023)]MDE8652400.1 TonB-dependent receptor [Novosphingobium album (ex Liu et al. 2023)]
MPAIRFLSTDAPATLALSAAMLAALAPWAARAEEAAPLSPIVVTGRGLDDTPATPAYDVTEIGREVLTTSASGRIEDALSSIAGFQQFRRSDSRSANPSAQGVTLRALGGNASSRTLVLLDGVPVGNPFFGYIPLSALAPQRLGAVRVTRGGGSGAFGSGAVAGTIELTSAAPGTMGLLDGEALVNDRGETQAALTAAPTLGQGFLLASVQWDRGQGFWTTPKDQRVPASARAGYESWSAALRAVAPLSDTVEIQAAGLVYDDRRTLRFAGADSTSSGSQASLRLVGRGDWQFDALGYVQAQDFSNIVVSSTRFVPTLDQKKTPATGIGGKFELRPPVPEAHVLRLGTDVRVADGKLLETPVSTADGQITSIRRAGGRTSDLGFYAEDDWTLGTLTLTAGVRADRWTVRDGFYREVAASGAVMSDTRFADRSGWESNWRGGVVWRAAGGLRLRAAAYTGFRQPTPNELYRPFVVFPITTNANADLGNERLRGYEAGIDYEPSEAIALSLTAFDNRVRDAIANVTIDATTRQRQNVEAVRARGIEASAALRLGTVSFAGSLAWTDAEVQGKGASAGLDGMRPAQVPRLAASATLAWAPRADWRLAATLRHVGSQYEDDLETDILPAATTLDAYAEMPLAGRFSAILRAENLTDTRIVTRNQAGSMDLGTPRTVWAGLRVRLGR